MPHGYDPTVHYWPTAPSAQVLDVVLAATWRPEYHRLMLDFATEMRDGSWHVGLAGDGWSARRSEFPPHWSFAHTPTGREYGTFLRSGRIAIAPVQREVVVSGKRQPGDEDSTRTYELAAAQCFFLHRRTDYVQTVFDERTEVPLWDDARELAALVRHFLPRDRERRTMAAAAHARAVPEYPCRIGPRRSWPMFALNWRRVIPSPHSEAVLEEMTCGGKRQPVGTSQGRPRIGLVVPALEQGGGVPAVAEFVCETIERSSSVQSPKIVSLAMSYRDPFSVSLTRPASWVRGVDTSEGTWQGRRFIRIGAFGRNSSSNAIDHVTHCARCSPIATWSRSCVDLPPSPWLFADSESLSRCIAPRARSSNGGLVMRSCTARAKHGDAG